MRARINLRTKPIQIHRRRPIRIQALRKVPILVKLMLI